MRLSPIARSEAIAARAEERKISHEQAAQELSLAGNNQKMHIASTIMGLTVCGLSAFAFNCADPKTNADGVTCLRCRRYLR